MFSLKFAIAEIIFIRRLYRWHIKRSHPTGRRLGKYNKTPTGACILWNNNTSLNNLRLVIDHKLIEFQITHTNNYPHYSIINKHVRTHTSLITRHSQSESRGLWPRTQTERAYQMVLSGQAGYMDSSERFVVDGRSINYIINYTFIP